MTENAVVSREKELLQLTSGVLRSEAGHGGIIFLEGLAGMGKRTLIQDFRGSVSSSDGRQDITVASGYCYEVSGSNDSYEPSRRSCAILPSRKPDRTSAGSCWN